MGTGWTWLDLLQRPLCPQVMMVKCPSLGWPPEFRPLSCPKSEGTEPLQLWHRKENHLTSGHEEERQRPQRDTKDGKSQNELSSWVLRVWAFPSFLALGFPCSSPQGTAAYESQDCPQVQSLPPLRLTGL